jgi:hypothetical protein
MAWYLRVILTLFSRDAHLLIYKKKLVLRSVRYQLSVNNATTDPSTYLYRVSPMKTELSMSIARSLRYIVPIGWISSDGRETAVYVAGGALSIRESNTYCYQHAPSFLAPSLKVKLI